MKKRTEKDSLGEMEVPFEAYYGIQTQRAAENFPVSGRRAILFCEGGIKANERRCRAYLEGNPSLVIVLSPLIGT